MRIKNKIWRIVLSILPIVLMIGLIPIIKNDYLLTGVYILIIIIGLAIRREAKDFLSLIFGLVIMFLAEYFFISTGVEQFTRKTLLGVMPLWLPILWAYAFVAMKRAIVILS